MGEEKGHGKKRYPESRAVKIKLREALGLIWLLSSWLQARAVLIKYLILIWVPWTQPSLGYTVTQVWCLGLSGKW
jgi:hypothetical protein